MIYPFMMSMMIAMWSLLVVMPCYIGFLVLIVSVTSCLPIRLTCHMLFMRSIICHIATLHSDYAYAIKINPICTYGIDDKPVAIGICFSCDDIDMLPLHHLSHMPCHDQLASDMHCFGCCPFSPYDVSNIAHEETPMFPHTF